MKNILLILTLSLISHFNAQAQESYLSRGNAFLGKEDFDNAEKTFREGIEANPDDLILQSQLGLTLIQKKKYDDAEAVLSKVLEKQPNDIGANWYSGIGSFQNGKDRKAIEYFEKVLSLIDEKIPQYFAANWYVGKSYSILLKTEGLMYNEVDRMFACYEEYLRLQPNAKDSQEIREYVDRKKKRRPGTNVKVWVDL